MKPAAPRLPPNVRRSALAGLSRERLRELCDAYGLEVADRRQVGLLLAALVEAPTVDFGDVLGRLKREELQGACDLLGLDRGGREKQTLVDRILAVASDETSSGGHQEADSVARALVLTPPPEKAPRTPRTPRGEGEGGGGVSAYEHDQGRKNNPPAGLADLDRAPKRQRRTYAYDPHLDPQLTWAGKAERTSFEVDTVSLHIHERVSTQAILRAVKREEAQRSLFAEPTLPDSKAIDFYQHEVGWSNRLVLGDSLLVMSSLLERERMQGKVQCIYMDPPYGVKFNSNFQPSISRRDVKDGDDGSLTREPEQIQAYRDTWELGVHSYLTYLRDRLLLAKELLSESGSIFVQISDENVHHVRELMDEVLGAENFCGLITFLKTSSATSRMLAATADFILWYARDKTATKFRRLYSSKEVGGDGADQYTFVEDRDGARRRMTPDERANPTSLARLGLRVLRADNLTSPRIRENRTGYYPVEVDGREFLPGQGEWKTNQAGMARLAQCRRLMPIGNTLCYVRYIDDFGAIPIDAHWTDTVNSGFSDPRLYVVQTNAKAIERCILMTTDPGDLVLDPTCGSGTTAAVAEQWGRRWITCDTSRVALSLARQRLLTGRFPYYRLRSSRVRDGFLYKTVPHIMLSTISQNPKLDACETQAERERLIRESAEQETLYDQPEEDKQRVRVSGPFTVEAIPIATLEDPSEQAPPAPEPAAAGARVADPVGDYLGMMIDLLRKTGVQFAGGKHLALPALRAVAKGGDWLHAEAEAERAGARIQVAVSFGPRHAPVTPMQVLETIRETRGYDLVLFVGFACDPEARRIIDQGARGAELQFAHATPDILVGDLLKTKKSTRLFSVFGAPDVKVHKEADGLVAVELRGVDLYDPTTGETAAKKGEDVAAWFVDHDYDGRTFCICQALFPARGTKNPWEKLQKALKGTIDEEKFEALRGTKSVPFKPGKRVAVTVIDDRGNEVRKVIEVGK